MVFYSRNYLGIIEENGFMEEEKIVLDDISRTEYLSVDEEANVGHALEVFRDFESSNDKPSIYYVYLTDSENKLKGIVSVNDLLNADDEQKAIEIANKDFVSVSPGEKMENVARKMSKHDYQAFPVLDSDNVLKGIVRLDDMLEIMDREASEDIFKKAGFSLGFSSKEASKSDAVLNSSITDIIKIRLPWLFVALIGGLAAGEVIHGFEQSLQAVIALAFFIPVIMDMGGNVGTQASTIFVRGVALGHIDRKNVIHRVFKESVVGLFIGMIVGIVAGLFAYFRYNEPIVGLVLVISMTFTCLVASLVGFVIPWTAEKAGYDPAAVSDPLITTIKDITALLVYFASAYMLLGLG